MSRRGVTLIEVLVTIAVIALVSSVALIGSGGLTRGRVQGDAAMLTGAVRAAAAHADASGRSVRLVFDLSRHSVVMEESATAMLRQTANEADTSAGASPVTEAEKRAQAEAETIIKGPRAPKAEFQPIRELGFNVEQPAEGRPLAKGVRFHAVQTEHDKAPRETGVAYLYFWPGAGTERAVIQLQGDDASTGLTVLVSGLTARGRVERGFVELGEPAAGDAFGEAEAE